jgi:hypothetical protein
MDLLLLSRASRFSELLEAVQKLLGEVGP